MNPNYLFLSGEKAEIVRIGKYSESDIVTVSDKIQQTSELAKAVNLEGSPGQAQKRKGPKFSTYMLENVFLNGQKYFLLINNHHKALVLLKDKEKGEAPSKPKVSHFFKVNRT